MNENLNSTLADLSNVPPFPAIATKLLAVLAKPDVAADEVVKLILSDAALTARVLKHVNSALYAVKSHVTDIGQAVRLLGFDQIRQIVVMIATGGYAMTARHDVALQNCWRHSLATAVLADEIAKSYPKLSRIAFTAGVLHDIGRLGLMVAYPEYTRAIRNASGHYLDLLDFEREQFGMDHAEAGRLLIENWKLPEEFLAIAGRHHDPCQGPDVDLLQIVHAACELADVLGFCVVPLRSEASGTLAQLPCAAAKHLHGTAEELRLLVEEHISELS